MGKWINYNVNVCDNFINDLEIHFTRSCENNCPYCIDKMNAVVDVGKPDIKRIFATTMLFKDKFDYISIAGGEPCLYIHELKELCSLLKKYYPEKQLNLITAVPEICYKEKEVFYEILDLCDTITFSIQHHNQHTADMIRGKKSKFDREQFYKDISHKEKISLTINLLKGYLDTFDSLKECLLYYNNLGYTKFKICEIFKKPSMFVDAEKLLGITLPSPFAYGCNTKFDMQKLIPEFKGEVNLKRSCFYNNEKVHTASIFDLIKVCTRWLFRKKYFFGVVYGNGDIYKYWK